MSKFRKKPSWRCCGSGRIKITTQLSGKEWRRIVPGLLVSVICLAVVFYFVDLHKLGESLRLADYRLIAIAMLFSFAWLGVRGLVWRSLLQEKASYRQVFLAINEGYLLNNLLPFRLGEVGRAFLLSRTAQLDFWQVLSTILIERTLDVTLVAGMMLTSLAVVMSSLYAQASGVTYTGQAALASGGLMLVGLGMLYLLARNRQSALALFETISRRWPGIKRLGGNALVALLDGLAILTDGRRFLVALGWMGLNLLVATVQYYILMLAFIPAAQPLWAVFTLAAASLGVAAPSSPGNIGVYEAVVLGALSVFGVNSALILAFALTAHMIQYLVTGVLGIYALGQDGESLLHLYSQVRRLPEKPQP